LPFIYSDSAIPTNSSVKHNTLVLHFHCCIVDGVFKPASAGDVPRVDFHAATWIDETAIVKVQAEVRRRVLRTFVRRGLIDKSDAGVMGSGCMAAGFR
jgi:hypothetical protein